jgi:mono/diheme cytochrome c family protein
MNRTIAVTIATIATVLATPAFADSRTDLLAQYATAAQSTGFSAARGQTLHTRSFAGGKADTPACTACHGNDSRGSGRTPTGEAIDAVAISVTPTRYTNPAKVEKWFKRNCIEVLGRECTPQEKGDWLTYVISQ